MAKQLKKSLCLILVAVILLSNVGVSKHSYASESFTSENQTESAEASTSDEKAIQEKTLLQELKESEMETSEPKSTESEILESETTKSEAPEPGATEVEYSEDVPSGSGEGRDDLDLNNPAQVFQWMDENLPGTLAELENLPTEWWDSLLPNESLTAKTELLYRRFVGDCSQENMAEAQPDSIETYIAALEGGTSSEELFQGTIFEGLSLDDLYEFQASEISTDDLLAMAQETSLYAADEKATLQAVWEQVGNGRVNRKYLNGLVAFCFNEDRQFPNGATYSYKTAGEASITGRLAYIVQNYGQSGADNAQWWNQNQVTLWAIQGGADTREAAEAFARSYCHDRGITDPDTVQDYVRNIGGLVEGSSGQSGTAYLYQADNPANQDLATYIPVWGGGEEPPVVIQPEYAEVSASESRNATRTHSIAIDSKQASVTGENLSGAVFEIYEDSQKVGTITTDHNGQGSCSWNVEGTGSATVTKSYCSNYNDLSAEVQATVSGYTSRDAAYEAACSEAASSAQAQADSAANTPRTVEVKEMMVPYGFQKTSDSEQSMTLAGNDSKILKADNIPWKAKVLLDKADSVTGNRLAPEAGFTIYEWNGNSYVKSSHYQMIRLNNGTYTVQANYNGAEQGYLYYTQENEGKFYIQETAAPVGYVKNPDPVYFQITADNQVWVVENGNPPSTVTGNAAVGKFWNEHPHGNVTLHKYDNEAEANYEDGSRITQGDTSTLDGAVYGLYAAEDIYHPDGVTGRLYQKGQLVATATVGQSTVMDSEGYLLDENGQRCIESGKAPKLIATPGETNFQQVELGRYYIAEITPPDGYLPDTTDHRGEEMKRYPVTFAWDADIQMVVMRTEKAGDDDNQLTLDGGSNSSYIYSGDFVKKQSAQFVKLEDQETDTEKNPIQAGFSLYRIDTLAGVQNGEITPAGTAWTKNDMKQFIDYDFRSERTALLYKRSSEAWTEADRAWLVPTGERANEYQVGEMFSNENGYFCTPELPVGQYILVETTVPEGKVMADPLLVTITKDSSVPQAVRYIGNETTETYIRIKKTDRDSMDMDFHTVLKPGAKYRLRLLSAVADFDSEIWRVDKDGFLWYYNPTLDVKQGTEAAPFAVKCLYKNGKIVDAYIEFDQLLPVGEYELTEVAAPEGFVINGKEQVLVDASTDTKNAYEIQENKDSKVTFVIDNDVVYPDGQMGPDKNVSMDEYGRLIVTVEQENKEQKGIVEVSKYGEQLYTAEASGSRLSEKAGSEPFRFLSQTKLWDTADHVFDYQLAPVAGAVFNVYAAEDIYTQQLDRDFLELYADDISHYLVLQKGELAGTITTDASGFGYLSGLYLGKYYLEEVTAGEGFVLNTYREEFEMTATEPEQNFICYESSYTNDRQKIDLSVTKQDAETKAPLAGAIYGLYAAEDIINYLRYDATSNQYLPDSSGRKVISADTLIGTAITGSDGQAQFNMDLPLGNYYVVELEAPVGYTSLQAGNRIDVNASYAGQNTSIQVLDGFIFQNQKTRHVFTKSDIVSGALLSGALLEIREIMVDEGGKPVTDENGNFVTTLVESWVSDRDEVHYFYLEEDILTEIASPDELPEGRELITKYGHLIENLQAGRQYLFREITAPWGYVGYDWSEESVRQANREENLAVEEIRFTVEDSQLVAEHDMKDQRTIGKLAITKEGEFVVAAEKSFWDQAGDLFQTIFGYLFGRIENVSFDVWVREDILTPDQTGTVATYNNGKEEVQLVKDALVATITTDVNGIAVLENLPLGSYYITETSTGEGDFLLSKKVAEVTLEYPGQEIPVVTHDTTKYQNDRQRVALTVVKKSRYEDEARILNTGETLVWTGDSFLRKSGDSILQETQNVALSKMDSEDGAILVTGAVFGLYVAEDITGFEVNGQGAVSPRENALLAAGTLIEMAATGQDGSVTFLSDLPCGKYYVKELLAPKGYLLSEEVYEFDASYTGPDGDAVIELAHDFYDTPIVVPFSKQDSANGEELAGATLTVTDDSGAIIDEWISDGTLHYIRNLQTGRRYMVTETKAAPGYAVAESIVFELEQRKDESGHLLQEIIIKTDAAYLVDGVITMKDDRLPETPDQPELPRQPEQPHEDRPGEGGGDTGDNNRMIPGLCVLGIGLAGAAGCALCYAKADQGETEHDETGHKKATRKKKEKQEDNTEDA